MRPKNSWRRAIGTSNQYRFVRAFRSSAALTKSFKRPNISLETLSAVWWRARNNGTKTNQLLPRAVGRIRHTVLAGFTIRPRSVGQRRGVGNRSLVSLSLTTKRKRYTTVGFRRDARDVFAANDVGSFAIVRVRSALSKSVGRPDSD